MACTVVLCGCTKVYGWTAEVLSGTQFLFKEKTDYLRNELDGEELSVGFGDLTMLLGGVSKESYANTYDITQAGAATGNQMVKILAEYLTQASDGSDSGVTVAEAAASLNARKRELQRQEQRRADEEREVRLRELRLEKNLLEQECEGIRASIEKYEAHYADDESGMHAKYHEQTGSTEDWRTRKNWLYPILLRNPHRNIIIHS